METKEHPPQMDKLYFPKKRLTGTPLPGPYQSSGPTVDYNKRRRQQKGAKMRTTAAALQSMGGNMITNSRFQ